MDDLSELIRSQLIWLTIPGEPGLESGRPPTVHPLEASQEGLAAALGAMSTQRRSHGAGSLAWGRLGGTQPAEQSGTGGTSNTFGVGGRHASSSWSSAGATPTQQDLASKGKATNESSLFTEAQVFFYSL